MVRSNIAVQQLDEKQQSYFVVLQSREDEIEYVERKIALQNAFSLLAPLSLFSHLVQSSNSNSFRGSRQ